MKTTKVVPTPRDTGQTMSFTAMAAWRSAGALRPAKSLHAQPENTAVPLVPVAVLHTSPFATAQSLDPFRRGYLPGPSYHAGGSAYAEAVAARAPGRG